MADLTVACVKWGTRYSEVWARRLQSMVARHLSIPHRFVCLTDESVPGIDCVKLETALTGWWTKLELFKPGRFVGDVLYLDLDVVVTQSIDEIVSSARADQHKLWMRDDFSYSLRNPRRDLDIDTRRLLGGPGVCNSSVMAWHSDNMRAIWDEFDPAVMKVLHGDQNYISRLLWPDRIGFLPDALVGSYKYGQLRHEPMAPVMVFHGSPKMDELPRSNPLRQIWQDAA
jgi:hypothetical protein